MMAALQCDICGGKLIGRPGGVFECDSCGMEYDTAWAKEKIQEIKGTVKVEGTVEVTGKVQIDGGTVKVEGGVNIESFLKRGWLALEDKKWDDAPIFFDAALNLNAECAEAYFGKLCAKYKVSDLNTLLNQIAEMSGEYICALCGYTFKNGVPEDTPCPFCAGRKKKIANSIITDDSNYQKAMRFLDSTSKEQLQTRIKCAAERK